MQCPLSQRWWCLGGQSCSLERISTKDYQRKAYQMQNLHVIGVGDLSVLVTNDGELEIGSSNLINIPDPICVRLDGIRGQTDKLGSTLGELGLELGECAQLGGANRGEVL